MTEEGVQNDAPQYPANKDELLQRIEEAWTQVLATIDGVHEAVLVKPGATGWSIKDNLAHVGAWEDYLVRHYLGGQPPEEVWGLDRETWSGLDEDGLNGIIYERNRERPVGEVMDGLRRSHADVIDTLKRISFDDLMAPRPTSDGGTLPLLAWVAGNTYEHYEHHQADLESLLLPSVLGD